jgi:predicted RNA-binding Zn-ribbon protein involved in translation (DUF1610 family)
MGKTCLKCGYERRGDESAPDYECPKCGAVYAKVEAALKRRGEEATSTSTEARPPEPNNTETKQRNTSRKNPKLTRCRTCGEQVAITAKTCPHCGQKNPGVGTKDLMIGIGALTFIIWIGSLFLGHSSTPSSSAPRSSEPDRVSPRIREPAVTQRQPPPPRSNDHHIQGESNFGCIDREYRGKLVSAAVQKDIDAFKNGLAAGILTGQCVMFKSGEQVFLTDTAIFSGLVQVRRRGEMTSYWVNIEAVK